MKKITLLLFAMLALSLLSNAQTLNEPANWPNASWTLTGTYAPAGLLSNPTVAGTTFTWDDDFAGSASDDVLQLTSPVIDLTAASMAGETMLTISGDVVYRALGGDVLAIEIYNADAATWTTVQTFVGNSTNTNYRTCTGVVPYTTANIDISGYTATQLSGFQYRFSYNDQAGWQWGWCLTSPTIVSAAPLTDVLDYYNLQWPPTGNINASETFNVYAQAYEAGLTDVTSGQAPGIESWIGYSTSDTDPSGAGWTWVAASFGGEVGNNDEYTVDLGAVISATGTFYYASRWSLNGAPYTYGGIQADGSFGGVWGENNNISGVLTINPPANDACAGALPLTESPDYNCANAVSGTTVGANPSASGTCSATGKDVWYTFTPSQTSNYIFNVTETQDFGSSSTYVSVYSGSCGTTTQVGTGCSSSVIFVSLTAGSPYYVVVRSTSATNGVNFDLCAYPAPTPANNDCSGSITITPGVTFEANPVVGTTGGATGSGELPLPGCATYDPADVTGFGGDVWYAVTVPADGNLMIETNANPTGSGGDSGIAVYTGSCGALALFECDDDDSADDLYSLVLIESADNLANQTVYVRVWEFGGNAPLNFQVSAYNGTLSVVDVEQYGFTYYPNPVKNELSLRAQSNIQKVSIYNMLGQEVLRSAPNTLESNISMGELQTGAYFVKVTINDVTETVRVIKQ